MKQFFCKQGSPEWLKLRLGRPTASQFHRIVTPAKGQLSKQSRKYAYYLIAERVLNASLESISHLEWISRGRELEPQAVKMYEFEQETVTKPIGLVMTDDGRLAASPDRLIEGKAAALEIKCPAPQTHIEYMLEGFGADYIPQVQGQILIGEFDFVDRYSHHPLMPPVLVRTPRNDSYIKILGSALGEFCNLLDELMERAQARGVFYERKEFLTPIDGLAEDLGASDDREEGRDAFGLLPLADHLQKYLEK